MPKNQVIFLRRIVCHYHPVWVNGRGMTRLGDLDEKIRAFCGLTHLKKKKKKSNEVDVTKE